MTDDFIRRFNVGPGHRIGAVVDVALPVYEVTLRALTLAHKPIPAIEEFVLRSLRAGLTAKRDLASYLGLSDYPLRRALVSLAQQEFIALDGEVWRLTDKGIAAVQSSEIVVPEERTFQLQFDAILWEPVRYTHLKLLEANDLEDAGLRPLELVPPRRPKVGDFKAEDVERIVESIRPRSAPRRDVLDVLETLRARKRYIHAAAVLYHPLSDDELRVGFMIDAQRSDKHELRFAASEAFRKVSSEWAESSVDDAELADAFEEASIIEGPAGSPDVRDALRSAESELAAYANAGSNTKEEELERLAREVAQLKIELNKVDVRYLEMIEHPAILLDAISTAKSRLMIISPWMTTEVVNDDFVERLESTLKRGTSVFIGYGIGDVGTETVALKPHAEKARGMLRDLSERYPKFTFLRLGGTHAKLLVKDDQYAVITSFNWLSFRGDPSKKFRDEQGVLIQRADMVNEKWQKQVLRFS